MLPSGNNVVYVAYDVGCGVVCDGVGVDVGVGVGVSGGPAVVSGVGVNRVDNGGADCVDVVGVVVVGKKKKKEEKKGRKKTRRQQQHWYRHSIQHHKCK